MRYFKLITYTSGEEYETKETLIDEPTFRQFQKAIVDQKDFIVLENKVIKRGMIKEILPADDIIKEYERSGITPKQLGLKETPELEEKKVGGFLESL